MKSLCVRKEEEEDNMKQQYANSRKYYKRLIKQKKYNYYVKKISLLASNINDPRKFWKDIKSILGNSSVHNNIPIGDFFLHFSSIFHSNNQIPTICHEPVCLYYDNDIDQQLNIPIYLDEIKTRLSKLKPHKGAGPDEISNEMLHTASPNIINYLLHLFQYIFSNSKFPLEWTKSVVVPIHKKGDINSCDNYQPVSLTSLLSKVYTGILTHSLRN